MGLTEGLGSGGGNAKFLTVKNGYIAERCKDNTPGAVAVQKKDGSTVYELQYKDITGRLVGIKVRTHEEYGDFLQIRIRAKGQDWLVEMNLSSGYATAFLTTIPNADLEGLMMICPNFQEKDGKKKSTIFIQQDAGWLKRYFTRENPGKLPELAQIKRKGKVEWDDSDRLEFFKTMIVRLDEKLREIYGNLEEEAVAETQGAASTHRETEPFEDDLPF